MAALSSARNLSNSQALSLFVIVEVKMDGKDNATSKSLCEKGRDADKGRKVRGEGHLNDGVKNDSILS